MNCVIERRARKDPSRGFTLTCTDPAASIEVWKSRGVDGRTVMRVGHISVDRSYRRQGLGTKLYTVAARIACAEYGAPLASDNSRSRAAESFWRKQRRLGRASCVRAGTKRCGEYVLTCPAPATLARHR